MRADAFVQAFVDVAAVIVVQFITGRAATVVRTGYVHALREAGTGILVLCTLVHVAAQMRRRVVFVPS